MPALWALSGCSIFIASMTTTTSPSATSWPSSTATLTMVPCIGLVDGVAADRGAGLLAGRALRLLRAAAAAAGGEPAQAAGEHDLEPLAADLDDDGLALAGLLGLGGVAGVRA